jgi:uncharacterized protein (TIGR02646 family)
MIAVKRLPKPRVLERHEVRWRDTLLAAVTEAERRRAESKYRHPEIREALNRMFHGKCAYCESRITHVDYGKIEHYRPKRGPRGRPDLTFEWNNLLWACGRCNGPEFKADRFPEAAAGGPLVNPCDDVPEEHFQFVYDQAAKLASVYGRTVRGQASEKLLGLNRRDLRQYRSRQIRRLLALARLAESDPEAATLLQLAREADAEYAAFARVLLVTAGE